MVDYNLPLGCDCRQRCRLPREILLLFLLFFGMTYRAATQDRSYGRSVVMTDRGIVATSHYLASQAGAQGRAPGGYALGSAIAPDAGPGVAETMMNGIRGRLLLVFLAPKTVHVY